MPCVASAVSAPGLLKPEDVLYSWLQFVSPHVLQVLRQHLATDFEDVLYAQCSEPGSSHSVCGPQSSGSVHGISPCASDSSAALQSNLSTASLVRVVSAMCCHCSPQPAQNHTTQRAEP
jgi:hypothetical protein